MYRPCLRWEFGFTCAFCLIHEADLVEHGAQGTGLFAIEHHIPRSADPSSENLYENCFYACRYCNESRSSRPVVDAEERKLLEPCTVAWGEHFKVVNDTLVAAEGDKNAKYTHEAYDLDDPRKRIARSDRVEALQRAAYVLSDVPHRIQRLVALAENLADNERIEILNAARELHLLVEDAKKQLARYSAIPKDAPS